MIHILYVGLRYDYGKEEQGSSYEHMNIEAGLRAYCRGMGWGLDVFHPDVDTREDLVRLVMQNAYQAVLNVDFNEEHDIPDDVAQALLKSGTQVIVWNSDSSWRFHNFILPRRHKFSHFITTHSKTIPWYQENDMKVIRSQWAGSPLYVRDWDAAKKYDVSFVGQSHGQMPDGRHLRRVIADALITAGIDLHIWGNYWDGFPNWHGYAKSFDEVIEVFNESKICLNLSNPWHHGTMSQVKGRHYEIPQVGGFQLTTPADDLERYFVPDKEIVVVKDIPEMIAKVKHYLYNSDEREAIANAGYQRMLKDHQWSNRFRGIFSAIGVLQ